MSRSAVGIALGLLFGLSSLPVAARPIFFAYASGDAYYCGAGAAHLTINFDGGVEFFEEADRGKFYDLIGYTKRCDCFLFCGQSPACNDTTRIGGTRQGVNCAWSGTYACAQGTPEFKGLAEVGFAEGPVATYSSDCIGFTCTDPVH
jgi:hypothetical protein